LQLPHPPYLHGEIATDFPDLAFDSTRQFGGSAARLSPPRADHDSGAASPFASALPLPLSPAVAHPQIHPALAERCI
jgi:hypothetical protein